MITIKRTRKERFMSVSSKRWLIQSTTIHHKKAFMRRLLNPRLRAAVLSLVLAAASLEVGVKAAEPIEVLKTKSGLVNVERLARLEFPWAMAFMPDHRLLIT